MFVLKEISATSLSFGGVSRPPTSTGERAKPIICNGDDGKVATDYVLGVTDNHTKWNELKRWMDHCQPTTSNNDKENYYDDDDEDVSMTTRQ